VTSIYTGLKEGNRLESSRGARTEGEINRRWLGGIEPMYEVCYLGVVKVFGT